MEGEIVYRVQIEHKPFGLTGNTATLAHNGYINCDMDDGVKGYISWGGGRGYSYI